MSLFLSFAFLFCIGSSIGWVLELFYRRFIESKKWVNPGFLVGPYLPIYGFGLVILTALHLFIGKYNFHPAITIVLMGSCMILLELITGLFFLKFKIRLWDYRNYFLNFKGVICLPMSLLWIGLGGLYYYLLADYVMKGLAWFSTHLSFSYVLGIFTGVFFVDLIYSTKFYKKIRKYAKNNNVVIMYENFKLHIRNIQEAAKEKYSFILPFKQTRNLLEYLVGYKPEEPEVKKKTRKKAKNEHSRN